MVFGYFYHVFIIFCINCSILLSDLIIVLTIIQILNKQINNKKKLILHDLAIWKGQRLK